MKIDPVEKKREMFIGIAAPLASPRQSLLKQKNKKEEEKDV